MSPVRSVAECSLHWLVFGLRNVGLILEILCDETKVNQVELIIVDHKVCWFDVSVNMLGLFVEFSHGIEHFESNTRHVSISIETLLEVIIHCVREMLHYEVSPAI